MKRIVLLLTVAAAVLGVSPAATVAGPNAGGTLILHANTSIVYTDGVTNYCGQANLDSCSAAVTSVEADPGVTTVFFAMAAFPEGSSPRLVGVTFGIQYDVGALVLAASGSCADFELATVDWPAPGSGDALTWNSAQTGLLTEAYWFAAYAYEDTASFADDAVPSGLDDIAALGRLGFGTDGIGTCPEPLSNDEEGPGGPGAPDIGGDVGESASAHGIVLVRFEAGAISFPSAYNQRNAHFVASLNEATIPSEALVAALNSIGVTTLEPIAPEWRFLGEPPIARDELGNPVTLVDFTDVYRVTFGADLSVSSVVAALLAVPQVEYAEADPLITLNAAPNDSLFPVQWALADTGQVVDGVPCTSDIDINAPEAWGLASGGWHLSSAISARVAVSDGRVNTSHEDLQGRFDRRLSRSFVDPDHPEDWENAFGGHGTYVSGVIGARTNNVHGIASVTKSSPADSNRLVALRVSEAGIDALTSNGAAALAYVTGPDVAGGIRVVNQSWGYSVYRYCYSYSRTLRDAMRNAFLVGISLVCSGGNGCLPDASPCYSVPPDSCLNIPAAFEDYAFAVAGVDCQGHPVEGYSLGSYLDLAAPGWQVMTTSDGANGYLAGTGTSLAAPHASGAISVLIRADSTLTNEDCYAILRQTSMDLNQPRVEVGSGLLRLDDALRLVLFPSYVAHASSASYEADSVDARWVEFKNVPALGLGEEWDSLWVHVYELTASAFLWHGDSSVVQAVWPRGKTTTGCKLIDDKMGSRYDGQFHANYAQLDSWDADEATFTTYTYKVFADSTEDAFVCWFPFRPASDPDSCPAESSFRLDYSFSVRMNGSTGVTEARRRDDWTIKCTPSVCAIGDNVTISPDNSRSADMRKPLCGRKVLSRHSSINPEAFACPTIPRHRVSCFPVFSIARSWPRLIGRGPVLMVAPSCFKLSIGNWA